MHLDEDWFKETRALYLNVKLSEKVSHPCPICPVLKSFLTMIGHCPPRLVLGSRLYVAEEAPVAP